MEPHIRLYIIPIISVAISLVLPSAISRIALVASFVMFLVHRNHHHVVVFHAHLKHIPECQHRALLRNLHQVQTALTQIELSIYLHYLFRSVCRSHDQLIKDFSYLRRVVSLTHQGIQQ